MKLKINIHLMHAYFLEVLKETVYLESVGKVHSNFCNTEDECVRVGPDKELYDGVV